MQIRSIGIGLTIAAASFLTPTISSALTGKTSLDACVAAFEKSLDLSSSRRAYKVVYPVDRFSSGIARFYQNEYTYDLTAGNPKTGEVYADARCLVDSRGNVSLSSFSGMSPAVVRMAQSSRASE
jgi:hypothetical protein